MADNRRDQPDGGQRKQSGDPSGKRRRPSGRGGYAEQEFVGEQRYDERRTDAASGSDEEHQAGAAYETAQGYGPPDETGPGYSAGGRDNAGRPPIEESSGGPAEAADYGAMEGYRGQGAAAGGGGGGYQNPRSRRSGYAEENPAGLQQVEGQEPHAKKKK